MMILYLIKEHYSDLFQFYDNSKQIIYKNLSIFCRKKLIILNKILLNI